MPWYLGEAFDYGIGNQIAAIFTEYIKETDILAFGQSVGLCGNSLLVCG